jgi:hypothetical protein
MILGTLLFYLTTIYDIKSLIINLNFEKSSHKILFELTRVTHI